MHKGQEGANVKTHYEFGSDPMKCVSKVHQRIKNIIIMFLSH
jgi:hypothetical protein